MPFGLVVCPDEGCACALSDHDGYHVTERGMLIPVCRVCEGECVAAADSEFAKKVRARVDKEAT